MSVCTCKHTHIYLWFRVFCVYALCAVFVFLEEGKGRALKSPSLLLSTQQPQLPSLDPLPGLLSSSDQILMCDSLLAH